MCSSFPNLGQHCRAIVRGATRWRDSRFSSERGSYGIYDRLTDFSPKSQEDAVGLRGSLVPPLEQLIAYRQRSSLIRRELPSHQPNGTSACEWARRVHIGGLRRCDVPHDGIGHALDVVRVDLLRLERSLPRAFVAQRPILAAVLTRPSWEVRA